MSDVYFPPEVPTKSNKASALVTMPSALVTPSGRGLGWKPDTHDKSKDPTVRGLLGAPLRMPAEYSLQQWVPGIFDQLQTSSCTGWAFAQAILLRCTILGVPIPLPSPEALYVFARAFDRKLAGLSPDVPLKDDGAQPYLVVQGMAEWGVPSNVVWPFDPATINNEPNLEELEVASAFIVQSCNRVTSTGDGRLLDIRHAISNDYPVIIGTAVDQAFENYQGGKQKNGLPNVVTAPVPSQVVGGHMMHLIGYTSTGLFRGVNQWGTSWGDYGYYWADEAFITTDYMTDVFVLSCSASGH